MRLRKKAIKLKKGRGAQMGWRYVTYFQKKESLSLIIEPMFSGPDIVFVPDESTWKANAPNWAQPNRIEILKQLMSIKWNRDLKWEQSTAPFGTHEVAPGSPESTEAGRFLENARLFNPGNSEMTRDQVREVWHILAQRFSKETKGKVIIVKSDMIPNSVVEKIMLPNFKKNPNVVLDIK